jgi:hypothetical protein
MCSRFSVALAGKKIVGQGFPDISRRQLFSCTILSWVTDFTVNLSLNFLPSNSCGECDYEFTRCMESKNKRLHQTF